MIPERDAVQALDRDLVFRPTQHPHPTVLTGEQIAAFHGDGFLIGLPVFSADEIAAHRRYFDALLTNTLAAGGDSYSISSAHLKYGKVYDLLTNPRIVAYVGDVLGPNVIGWGSHYFCKLPGDPKRVSWHQDVSYWPLSAARTVTVWLAIDDADTENACMRFLRGSHRDGLLPFETSTAAENNVLDQTIAETETARFGDPVEVVLRAGEISLHSDLLVHGSEANLSERRRCGLTLRYCPADVRAELDWHQKGVVVSGTDADHHWANPRRPTGEDG